MNLECFTMTNIQQKHGHKNEIDLLAVNIRKKERYHVEVSIRTDKKLKFYGRGKDDYSVEKFLSKFHEYRVERDARAYFNNEDYQKILVVWATQEPVEEYNKKCEKQEIKIWLMPRIILQMTEYKNTSGSRDDILRVFELVFLEKKWEKVLEGNIKKKKVPVRIVHKS